jgi:ADP-ribose pyrophosphatase
MAAEEEVLFEARRFAVVAKMVTRPDGEPARCKYVRHGGSVAILPILNDGRVCLIRNRRVTVDQVLIEVPAGTREPSEPPIETARRELIEETGFHAKRFDELVTFYPSPGMMSEQMWLFVARDLTAGNPAREANEEIENLIVTFEEALAMIERGEIRDGKTIVALLLWERRKNESKR